MSKKTVRYLASAIALVLGLSVMPAFAADDDLNKRVVALEEQLKRQNEQNEQMLKLLQSMANQGAAPAVAEKAAAETNAAPIEAKTPSMKVSPDQFAPGWIARVYAVDEGYDFSSGIPKTELGKFVANKSEYRLAEYSQFINMKVSQKAILWRGEAFLEVKETGSHVFMLNLWDWSWGVILVEGVEIGSAWGSGKSILGTAELEPGIYKIEFRVAGAVDGGKGRALAGVRNDNGFSMAVKRPSDDTPVPISEVFLMRKGSK